MKKIRLSLEKLNVDSFDAGPTRPAEGTVNAHMYSNLGTCGLGAVATCQYQGTCQQTCWNGCSGGSYTRLC